MKDNTNTVYLEGECFLRASDLIPLGRAIRKWHFSHLSLNVVSTDGNRLPEIVLIKKRPMCFVNFILFLLVLVHI